MKNDVWKMAQCIFLAPSKAHNSKFQPICNENNLCYKMVRNNFIVYKGVWKAFIIEFVMDEGYTETLWWKYALKYEITMLLYSNM